MKTILTTTLALVSLVPLTVVSVVGFLFVSRRPAAA